MNAKRVAKKKAIKEDDATIGIKEIFAIRLRTLANEIKDWKTFKDKTGLSSPTSGGTCAPPAIRQPSITATARCFGMSDFEFLFLERPNSSSRSISCRNKSGRKTCHSPSMFS